MKYSIENISHMHKHEMKDPINQQDQESEKKIVQLWHSMLNKTLMSLAKFERKKGA